MLGRKSSKTEVTAEEESKELPSTGLHKKDEEESAMYKTLKDAVDSCRAAESSQNQLAEIRKGEAFSVNEVSNQGVKCFKCNTLGHYPSGDPNGYSRGRKKKSRGGRGRGRQRGKGGLRD